MTSVVPADMATTIKTAIQALDYGTEADPKPITIDQITLAIATGVCAEINDWISEQYDPHILDYNAHVLAYSTHVHLAAGATSNTGSPIQP